MRKKLFKPALLLSTLTLTSALTLHQPVEVLAQESSNVTAPQNQGQFTASPALNPNEQANDSEYEVELSQELLARVNELRAKNGLSQLTENDALTQAAIASAYDDFANEETLLSHELDDVRAVEAGYLPEEELTNTNPIEEGDTSVGTNLFFSQGSKESFRSPANEATEVVNYWYADIGQISRGHREAMLNPIWDEAGTAVIRYENEDGGYGQYIAQYYGTKNVEAQRLQNIDPTDHQPLDGYDTFLEDQKRLMESGQTNIVDPLTSNRLPGQDIKEDVTYLTGERRQDHDFNQNTEGQNDENQTNAESPVANQDQNNDRPSVSQHEQVSQDRSGAESDKSSNQRPGTGSKDQAPAKDLAATSNKETGSLPKTGGQSMALVAMTMLGLGVSLTKKRK